jgi:uncharacterized iron-regulated protein
VRDFTICCSILLLAGCAGRGVAPAQPGSFPLPDSVVVLEGGTGERLESAELLGRLVAADFVLLGEVHDNGGQHALRGQLIAALSDRRPAIVFEQFAESLAALSPPGEGVDLEGWLDGTGFDREAWKWPLHRPVIEAAIAYGRSLWGSGLSREALRSVVRDGESAAPAHLRPLLEQAPLDGAAQAALDRELVDGHCGQLPEAMIPGMRAAQAVRDAAMTNALLRAAGGGPAWLIAGNGHVRGDIGVPRLLRAVAPGRRVLTVGFLERTEVGGEPAASVRTAFDVVVVTPRVARPDPCAGFRVR